MAARPEGLAELAAFAYRAVYEQVANKLSIQKIYARNYPIVMKPYYLAFT